MRDFNLKEERVKIPSEMMSKLIELRDEFDGIVETLDIMSNKKLMQSVRKSKDDLRKNKLISWKDLQKRWKKEHAKV